MSGWVAFARSFTNDRVSVACPRCNYVMEVTPENLPSNNIGAKPVFPCWGCGLSPHLPGPKQIARDLGEREPRHMGEEFMEAFAMFGATANPSSEVEPPAERSPIKKDTK